MYTVKWSVLRYAIIRPLGTIAGIICERYGVLCGSAGFNIHFASVWIQAIEFVSISVALYGLVVFYGLMSAELEGKRPMSKFAVIKLIVMFTSYQSSLSRPVNTQFHHRNQPPIGHHVPYKVVNNGSDHNTKTGKRT
ncbi:hypothetical protein M378DRAFT_951421 [Amanita muscaria Koide BX008]|uniref:Uncharacterized protein n=1 Tax=Amanita muscaria (strain Koide BX008) TaxID=946122 RepID=A0A0C2SBJ8_AMAMK|nr:hypothetical protein M378DRAFT_951421 [Amanita muscaria Koide BX008]